MRSKKATISAESKRTFQVKPYESETVTVGYTYEIDLNENSSPEDGSSIQDKISALQKSLSKLCDSLVAERLAQHKKKGG
jgi:hypothetical protein